MYHYDRGQHYPDREPHYPDREPHYPDREPHYPDQEPHSPGREPHSPGREPYYPDREPHSPGREPYNMYGDNGGYQGKPRGRNDDYDQSAMRRQDRGKSARSPTRVPYVQNERFMAGQDRDNFFNDAMSEPHDGLKNSTSSENESKTKTMVVIAAFCLLLFLVLGALALGGVALYFAYFDTPTDTYFATLMIDATGIGDGITSLDNPIFTEKETTVCNGMKAVFGSELKSCSMDFLQKVGDSANATGRLRFHRNKLISAADEDGPAASLQYIVNRIKFACFTELICSFQDVDLLPKEGRFEFTSNFSTALTKVGMRNDSNYYAAETAVCDTIKTQISNVYVNCYVTNFKTDGGDTHIVVTVNNNALLDETRSLKTLNLYAKLTNLINSGAATVNYFNNNVVLKVTEM